MEGNSSFNLLGFADAEAHKPHVLMGFMTFADVFYGVWQGYSFSQILQLAARSIGQVVGADRVEVVQYFPDQSLWRNISDYRRYDHYPSALGLEIPDADNHVAAQLKQGKVVYVGNATTIEDSINPAFAEAYPGTWLVIPIKVRDQIWGAVSPIRNDENFHWSQAEFDLMLFMVDQVAIAIQQYEYCQAMRQSPLFKASFPQLDLVLITQQDAIVQSYSSKLLKCDTLVDALRLTISEFIEWFCLTNCTISIHTAMESSSIMYALKDGVLVAYTPNLWVYRLWYANVAGYTGSEVCSYF